MIESIIFMHQVHSPTRDHRPHVLVQYLAVQYRLDQNRTPVAHDSPSVFVLLVKSSNHGFSAPDAVVQLLGVLQGKRNILHGMSRKGLQKWVIDVGRRNLFVVI